MAASTRIIGQNIIFKLASTTYAPDINMFELTLGDAPGGQRTMTEVRSNGEWTLKLSGIVSGESDSLYRLLWENFGTEVAFVCGPNGNASPGADTPHYTGTVVFNELPPLSITSGEDVNFEVSLRVKNTGLDVASKLYYGVTVDVTA
jgi:hypothetical protein